MKSRNSALPPLMKNLVYIDEIQKFCIPESAISYSEIKKFSFMTLNKSLPYIDEIEKFCLLHQKKPFQPPYGKGGYTDEPEP